MAVEALHFGCATQLLLLVFGVFHIDASQCLLLAFSTACGVVLVEYMLVCACAVCVCIGVHVCVYACVCTCVFVYICAHVCAIIVYNNLYTCTVESLLNIASKYTNLSVFLPQKIIANTDEMGYNTGGKYQTLVYIRCRAKHKTQKLLHMEIFPQAKTDFAFCRLEAVLLAFLATIFRDWLECRTPGASSFECGYYLALLFSGYMLYLCT